MMRGPGVITPSPSGRWRGSGWSVSHFLGSSFRLRSDKLATTHGNRIFSALSFFGVHLRLQQTLDLRRLAIGAGKQKAAARNSWLRSLSRITGASASSVGIHITTRNTTFSIQRHVLPVKKGRAGGRQSSRVDGQVGHPDTEQWLTSRQQ